MGSSRKILQGFHLLLAGLSFAFGSVPLTAGVESKGATLSGRKAHLLSGLILRLHYEYREYNDEISGRTFANLLESLDPNKLHFMAGDVEILEKKFRYELDDFHRSKTATGGNEIINQYAAHFLEWQETIHMLIDQEHDFSIDETLVVHPPPEYYPKNKEERMERWRKRIKYQILRLEETEGDAESARDKLHERYRRSARRWASNTDSDFLSVLLNAFAQSLDPHTRYLRPRGLENFHISQSLSLFGIGARIQMVDGMAMIDSLIPSGPADRAGELQPGDKILAVAQGTNPSVDVIDWRLDEITEVVRGKKGTIVELTVLRETDGVEGRHLIRIRRDRIDLDDRTAKAYRYASTVTPVLDNSEEKLHEIGVIQLKSIYRDFRSSDKNSEDFRSVTRDVKNLIGELSRNDVQAIVVDLRDNSGGSLEEAVSLSGLFIDSGPIVKIEHPGGKTDVLEDTDGMTFYSGPLVILVNKRSASASEILAGALQDHGRAIIVGDSRTFGKGTVQHVREVHRGKLGAVKVTTRQFFLPAGSSTQVRGVLSDIVIPSRTEERKIGEVHNEGTLKWKEKEALSYLKDTSLDQHLPSIRTQSSARIALDSVLSKYFLKQDHGDEDEKREQSVSLMRKESTTEEEAAHVGNGTGKETTQKTAITQSQEPEKPSLKKDRVLREALAIAVDLVESMNNRELARIRFPEFEPEMAVAEKELMVPSF